MHPPTPSEFPMLASKKVDLACIRQFKMEFLDRMFGIRAHKLGKSQISEIKIPPQSNILGIGFGAKSTSCATVKGQYALRIYVREKLAKSDLSIKDRIPPYIDSCPTDVIVCGSIIAQTRPVSCGVSIGHYQIQAAGTLGCLVHRLSENDPAKRYILSNSHVLANGSTTNVGDFIVEPGMIDGGDAKNPIATLTEWKTLSLTQDNQFDAAIAKLIDPHAVEPEVNNIGQVAAPAIDAEIDQEVCKCGRTTGVTQGIVEDLSADIPVKINNANYFFTGQIGIRGIGGPFSQPGDSGSLVLQRQTRQPIGLLFCGNRSISFANSIEYVTSHFNIEIL